MNEFKITCPCHFGLESVLTFEMKRLGFNNVEAEDGKVSFLGGFSELACANVNLRTAERVMIVLGEFMATTFDELFESVKKLPLENFIAKKDAFPVTGWSLNSTLHSVPDCQSIIKKAAVERLKKKYGVSYFEETDEVHQLRFSIRKDKVVLMLDSSGVGLHKRGYRQLSNAAPIKETLAAGILDFARVHGDTVMFDPFCGSGTFLIEGAMRALNIAPGVNRKFAAEKWCQTPTREFENARREALEKINYDVSFHAYGSDVDEETLKIATENAKKAGVGKRIKFTACDIANFSFPEKSGVLVANPPYGERMLDIVESRELYKRLGELYRETPTIPQYIISPDEEFEDRFGMTADKRRKLYNGMIKCQLFMFFK